LEKKNKSGEGSTSISKVETERKHGVRGLGFFSVERKTKTRGKTKTNKNEREGKKGGKEIAQKRERRNELIRVKW